LPQRIKDRETDNLTKAAARKKKAQKKSKLEKKKPWKDKKE